MNDFSESLREACKKLENDSHQVSTASNFSNKIRESARMQLYDSNGVSDAEQPQGLSFKRHKKFALAKLEIEKTRSKSKGKTPIQEDVEDLSISQINRVVCVKKHTEKAAPLKSCLKTSKGGPKTVKFMPETLFWDAAFEGDFESLRSTTIDNVNKPNNSGVTALHSAASSGSFECVQHLIGLGADVNLTDDSGWTPIHYAAHNGWLDICKLLIESGANVNMKTQKEQLTAYDVGLADPRSGCSHLIKEYEKKKGIANNRIVYSSFDLVKSRPDELSLKKGERMRIVDKESEADPEWWLAENERHEIGYVPQGILTMFPRKIIIS